MTPQVDQIIADGCGRCELYQTDHCKMRTWQKELKRLRSIILDLGLTEEVKWKQPCYTYGNSNVLILSAFKGYAFISFFKGVLLNDSQNLLSSPGKNSQATRQLRFTSLQQIEEQKPWIETYIQQAIEVEKKGLKVEFKQKDELKFPDELIQKFRENPAFDKAFTQLTPGRQRSWILFYTGAKQSQTRVNRHR